MHRGRVMAMVVEVTPSGEQPNTVICGDCRGAIGAQLVWWASYSEGDDGWYYPDKEQGPASARLASLVGPSAPAAPLPPTGSR